MIADLMKSKIEQIKKILLKMIEMLKIDLKKKRRKFIEINSNIEFHKNQISSNWKTKC